MHCSQWQSTMIGLGEARISIWRRCHACPVLSAAKSPVHILHIYAKYRPDLNCIFFAYFLLHNFAFCAYFFAYFLPIFCIFCMFGFYSYFLFLAYFLHFFAIFFGLFSCWVFILGMFLHSSWHFFPYFLHLFCLFCKFACLVFIFGICFAYFCMYGIM